MGRLVLRVCVSSLYASVKYVGNSSMARMSSAFRGCHPALSRAPHISALRAAGEVGSGPLAGHALGGDAESGEVLDFMKTPVRV